MKYVSLFLGSCIVAAGIYVSLCIAAGWFIPSWGGNFIKVGPLYLNTNAFLLAAAMIPIAFIVFFLTRNVLKVMAILFICLTVAGALGQSVKYRTAILQTHRGRVYAQEAITAIAGSWDPKQLLMRAGPELLQNPSIKNIDILFQSFSENVGPFKDFTKPVEGRSYSALVNNAKVVTGKYSAEIECEKAIVDIKIHIIYRDEKWAVMNFQMKHSVPTPQTTPAIQEQTPEK